MEQLIEIRDGWYWPKSDIGCWQYLNQYSDVPVKCFEFVKNKKVIIQAGGNCGFYVRPYADIFETVYTFEPDELNFYCLNKNILSKNVLSFQHCLGEETKLVGMRGRRNVGRHSVDVDSKHKHTTMITIDSLNLDTCDLIHLDIEGYELFALRGAAKTIARCKPTIILESVDNNIKFNYTDADVIDFLSQFGYKVVGRVYTDIVFQI
jgi:FkbM family methyltransferase